MWSWPNFLSYKTCSSSLPLTLSSVKFLSPLVFWDFRTEEKKGRKEKESGMEFGTFKREEEADILRSSLRSDCKKSYVGLEGRVLSSA